MGFFPRLSRILLPVAAAGLLLTAGCGRRTPEDQLLAAQDLVRAGQTSYAIVRFNDLIRQHPESDAAIEARLNLMMLFAQQGGELNTTRAAEMARDVYQLVTLDDMRGQGAYMFITEVLLRRGDFDAALAHLEAGEQMAGQASTREFFEAVRYEVLMLSPDKERQVQGEEFFRNRMLHAGTREERGQAREVLAQHFRLAGRFAESNAVYDQFLEVFPDDSLRAQMVLVQALNWRFAGEHEKSEEVRAVGMELFEADIEEELNLERRAQMLMEYATLLRQFDDFERAEAAYRRIMREQPMRPIALQAQFSIGDMFASAGMWDQARKLFEAIERENRNTQFGQSAQQALLAIERQVAMQQQAEAQAAAVNAAPAAESNVEEAAEESTEP